MNLSGGVKWVAEPDNGMEEEEVVEMQQGEEQLFHLQVKANEEDDYDCPSTRRYFFVDYHPVPLLY